MFTFITFIISTRTMFSALSGDKTLHFSDITTSPNVAANVNGLFCADPRELCSRVTLTPKRLQPRCRLGPSTGVPQKGVPHHHPTLQTGTGLLFSGRFQRILGLGGGGKGQKLNVGTRWAADRFTTIKQSLVFQIFRQLPSLVSPG